MDLKLLQIQKILENIEAESPKFDLEKLASSPKKDNRVVEESVSLSEAKEKLEKVAECILNFVDKNMSPLTKFASAHKLSPDEEKSLFLSALYNKTLYNIKQAMDEDKKSDEEEDKASEDSPPEDSAKSDTEEDVATSGESGTASEDEMLGSLGASPDSGAGGDLNQEADSLTNILDEIEKALNEEAPEGAEGEMVESATEESPEETSEEAPEDLEKKSNYEAGVLDKKDSKKDNKKDKATEAKTDNESAEETVVGVCPDCKQEPCVCEGVEKDASAEEYENLKSVLLDEENVACLDEVLKEMKINIDKLPNMVSQKHLVKKAIANKIATDISVYRMKHANTKKANIADNEIKMLMRSYLKSLLNI